MIQAKDLRIGNYIKVGGVIEQIKQLHGEYCITDKHNSVSYKELQPISLIPEILERCGFEKQPEVKWHGNGYDYQPAYAYTIQNDYTIQVPNSDNNFIVRYEDNYLHDEKRSHVEFIFHEYYPKVIEGAIHLLYELKPLHQLQNLYFALTGTELSITL